jgi:acid phosphatase family membrane protein YuiD
MEYQFNPGTLFLNPAVWCALASWMVAQITKMLCGLTRTKRIDFSYLVSTGGMPSAHSAMSVGLAMGVGYMSGFGSSVFAIALGVASLTMFDASTVRRAAGQQARVLNQMVDELLKDHRLSERKLKELLGHTRLEVLMGAIVGILTSTLIIAKLALS